MINKIQLLLILIVVGVFVPLAFSEDQPPQLQSCIQCHGLDGVGVKSNHPNLAGQKKEYILKQLKDFKEGTRKDDEMTPAVKLLSDESMEILAEYFSSLNKKP
jgi:cytochrome c553